MFRVLVEKQYSAGFRYVEAACLHADTKKTGTADGVKFVTGSLCLEVDTGDVYSLDETGAGTWNKIAELGGGSESGTRSLSMAAPRLNLGLTEEQLNELNELNERAEVDLDDIPTLELRPDDGETESRGGDER